MPTGLENAGNLGRGDRPHHQAWNSVVEAARRVLGAAPGTSGRSAVRPGVESGLTIWVRNDTGTALAPHEVVRIGDPVVDLSVKPLSFQGRPVFKGLATLGTDDQFAITVGAIKTDGFGQAILSGMAVAKVNVGDEDHSFVVPTVASANLSSSTSGSKILFKPTGTGVLVCVVLIDGANALSSPGPALTVVTAICQDPTTKDIKFAASKITLPAGSRVDPIPGCTLPADCTDLCEGGSPPEAGDCGFGSDAWEWFCLARKTAGDFPRYVCLTLDPPTAAICTGAVADRRVPMQGFYDETNGSAEWNDPSVRPIKLGTTSGCGGADGPPEDEINWFNLKMRCDVALGKFVIPLTFRETTVASGTKWHRVYGTLVSCDPLLIVGTMPLAAGTFDWEVGETDPPSAPGLPDSTCDSPAGGGSYPDACFKADKCPSDSLCLDDDTLTLTPCFDEDPDDPYTSSGFEGQKNGGAWQPFGTFPDSSGTSHTFTPTNANYAHGDQVCIRYTVNTSTASDTDTHLANCNGNKACWTIVDCTDPCSAFTCDWEWNGSDWDETANNCADAGEPTSCTCSKPPYDGSEVGETATTYCAEGVGP